jgi:hypothetical protein
MLVVEFGLVEQQHWRLLLTLMVKLQLMMIDLLEHQHWNQTLTLTAIDSVEHQH